MSVYLGRGDGGVAQHFLNGAQIGPVLYEMRREGVPERMRRDRFKDPGLFCRLPDQSPELDSAHRAFPVGNKQRLHRRRGLWPGVQVPLDREARPLPDRNHAFFPPFTENPHAAQLQVDGIKPGAGQLAQHAIVATGTAPGSSERQFAVIARL